MCGTTPGTKTVGGNFCDACGKFPVLKEMDICSLFSCQQHPSRLLATVTIKPCAVINLAWKHITSSHSLSFIRIKRIKASQLDICT